MSVCRFCGTEGDSLCSSCFRRLQSQVELVTDTTLHRQRVLDVDVGQHFGARLIIGFVAPARSHFDLGYALVGEYATVPSGGNEHAVLHGPWDAVDAAGASYRGIGAAGEFEQARAAGVIRLVPEHDGPGWKTRPAPGRLALHALPTRPDGIQLQIEVPPPASWEL